MSINFQSVLRSSANCKILCSSTPSYSEALSLCPKRHAFQWSDLRWLLMLRSSDGGQKKHQQRSSTFFILGLFSRERTWKWDVSLTVLSRFLQNAEVEGTFSTEPIIKESKVRLLEKSSTILYISLKVQPSHGRSELLNAVECRIPPTFTGQKIAGKIGANAIESTQVKITIAAWLGKSWNFLRFLAMIFILTFYHCVSFGFQVWKFFRINHLEMSECHFTSLLVGRSWSGLCWEEIQSLQMTPISCNFSVISGWPKIYRDIRNP